jgi:hypothetical protein
MRIKGVSMEMTSDKECTKGVVPTQINDKEIMIINGFITLLTVPLLDLS